MIDLSLKVAVAAGGAWLLTRRVTHVHAAAAHRLWCVVLLSPILCLLASTVVAPVAYVHPRSSAWPEALLDPSPIVQGRIAATYLAMAAVLLIRLGWGLLAVHRLRTRATGLSDGDLELLRSSCHAPRIVSIMESPLDVPVTAGIFRPMILLPAGWRNLTREALRAILHHEAAHVRRRDYAWGVGAAVMEALFWFHPAVWLAGNRLRWFAELASDAEGARVLGDREYASELLALAARWRGASRPRYGLTVGVSSSAGRRIALLLEEAAPSRRRPLLLACAAALLIAGIPAAATIRVSGPKIEFPVGVDIELHGPEHQTGHAARHRAAHSAH